MRRREFITLLGGAAAAWPLSARAQQARMPTIGFLNSTSLTEFAPQMAAFQRGLGEGGYVEGRNVAIQYRWAEGQYDRLPGLASDLVGRDIAVLVATGGLAASLAAKSATRTIPIVFNVGSDPVKFGLVASLNRPGGNITGVTFLINALAPKQLELFNALIPKATVMAFLVNPENPNTETDIGEVLSAAGRLGLRLLVFKASTGSEFEQAFAAMAEQQVSALVVSSDPFFLARHAQLAGLAARYRVPVMFGYRQGPVAGGLMSYGANILDSYRQVGVYTGRVLKGERPAELPVIQPTKFELVINLKTAKVLGLEVPASLLATADEVIE
jgi:putative ABC transport system substrate-binding protein